MDTQERAQGEPVDDPNAGDPGDNSAIADSTPTPGDPAPYNPPAFNYRDGKYTPLIEPGGLDRARPGEKPKRDRRDPARQMRDEGIAPLFPLDNL